MANDPRTFLVKNCGKALAGGVDKTQERKDFFNSLGKVGDLEFLNNSALGGKVGQGLRTLADTSNSIRTGVPGVRGPADAGEVLAETGISEGQTQQAANFNPGVVNTALAQADVIKDKVNSGDFNLEDIPGAFTDIQNLSSLVDGIFTGGETDTRDLELCGASPYARDLIAWAPKFKFLFVVEFIFADEFAAIDGKSAAFVIKNTTRPTVNFEHEEINMYNFWVRVPKRTSYEPMTMRFYDDNKNGAMKLYESYLKAVSPIANLSFGSMPENVAGAMEEQSMNFPAMGSETIFGGDGEFFAHGYSASLGALSTTGKVKNVFKRINIYHVFDYGNYMNTYRFLNPKILTLELDELDMANSEGTELSFQFAYDAVNISTDVPVSEHIERITSMTTNGMYPIKPDFKGEPKNDRVPGDPEEGGGFLNDVAAGVGTAVGTVTGAISGAIDFGTGVISDAFQATSDFAGSIFASGAAAASSAENAIRGNEDTSND